MQKTFWRYSALFLTLAVASSAGAQQVLTWEQVRQRFEQSNPTLLADRLNIDESKAEEITAFLRPNPQFSLTADGTQIAPNNGVWQPLVGTYVVPNFSYLHERDHKRELRFQSAQEGTRISQSQHDDLKRTMEYTLRSAFVNTLEAKAVLELAKVDLEYYDHTIQISRERFRTGDIAQID